MSGAPARLPYPGLRPFEEADHALFFGREEQVGGLLRLLEDATLVAVVGASGSGKSSLVRAGLLPAVREGFLLGTTDWKIAVVRPGEEPFRCLARQLAGVLPEADEPALLQLLRRSDSGLLRACEAAPLGAQARVLVVVDQFEELFAFRRAAPSAEVPISRDQAAAFVALLLRTAAEPAGRVRIVLTMRSDFLGDCEAFLGLPEAISGSQFLVPRMSRGQMEQAIVRPGQAPLGDFRSFTFEEGLVNRIVNEAGDRPDQLPLMQHALMRTWKIAAARGGEASPELRAADYEQAGTIEKALSNDADAAWLEIPEGKHRHVCRRMFLLLCDITADGQITRRRPPVAEVMEVAGAKLAEVERVLRAFQRDDRNFLLPPADVPFTENTRLDVSHEALLRRWELFSKTWLEEERRDAAELRRLAEQAELRRAGQGGVILAQDLKRIRQWKTRVSPAWSRRYVPDATWAGILELIEASRQMAAALLSVALAALLALTGSTVYSWWSTVRADAAQETAETALVNSFQRTIGLPDGDELRSEEEYLALWDLAELDSVPVRLRMLDRWFASEGSAIYGIRREALGLRAAGELNPEIRRPLASHAAALTDTIFTSLEKGNWELGDLSVLEQLVARLEREDLDKSTGRLARFLAVRLEASAELDLPGLSGLLTVLARRAGSQELGDLAVVLLAAHERAAKNGRWLCTDFAPAPALLVGRIDSATRRLLADRLATLMEQAPDLDQMPVHADCFNIWIGDVMHPEFAGAAQRVAGSLVRAMRDAREVGPLNERLLRLIEKMPPADALRWRQAGTEIFDSRVKEEEHPDRRTALAPTADSAMKPMAQVKDARRWIEQMQHAENEELAVLASSLSSVLEQLLPGTREELASLAADKLVAAMERAPSDVGLAPALAKLAPWLKASAGARLGERLVALLVAPRESEPVSELRFSIVALTPRLEPEDAARLAERLAAALDPIAQGYVTTCQSDALAALALRLSEPDALLLAIRLTAVLDQLTEFESREATGFALAATASRFPSTAQQARLLALSAMLRTPLPASPEAGEELDSKLASAQKVTVALTVENLVEVLKWPVCVGETEQLVLAELERKLTAQRGETVAFGGDLNSFLDRAKGLGIENHKTPARRPRLEDVQKELAALER